MRSDCCLHPTVSRDYTNTLRCPHHHHLCEGARLGATLLHTVQYCTISRGYLYENHPYHLPLRLRTRLGTTRLYILCTTSREHPYQHFPCHLLSPRENTPRQTLHHTASYCTIDFDHFYNNYPSSYPLHEGARLDYALHLVVWYHLRLLILTRYHFHLPLREGTCLGTTLLAYCFMLYYLSQLLILALYPYRHHPPRVATRLDSPQLYTA